MPPPARPLPDDLIPGILVRLAPDDPASVVRAAAVCKAWRRALAAPAFAARYRALHPAAPPVLGFLHRPAGLQESRFVPTPTTSFRPSPSAAQRSRHPLDCRHGRALLYDYGSLQSFVVWDPISGAVHQIPEVPDVLTNPAVLSAAAAGGGCDHGGGGKHFIVAFAGVQNIPEDDYFDAHACYYASDTGEWSVHINIHLDHGRYRLADRPAALVGDALYFAGESGFLLRYRYGLLCRVGRNILSAGVREADVLSVIEPPPQGKKRKRLGTVFAMAAEGGGLGLASLHPKSSRLYLWARETAAGVVGDGGDGRWVQSRVVDLKTLLPADGNPKSRPCLSGVGEDGSIIFVSTEDGVFTVELKSSRVKKVCSEMGKVDLVLPFMSFYTHSLLLKLASSKSAATPVGNQ